MPDPGRRILLEQLMVRQPGLAPAFVRAVQAMPSRRVRESAARLFVERALAAYNRRDWALNTLTVGGGYRLRFHEDPEGLATSAVPIDGKREYRGRGGYMEFNDTWLAAWEDMGFEVESVREIDRRSWLVLARQFGRGRSGFSLRAETAFVLRFEHGWLVEHDFWLDRAACLRELGKAA